MKTANLRVASTHMAAVTCTPKRNFSQSYNWNGGRASVSGIRATVFGCSGFLGRFVVNRLGRIGTQCVLPYRGDGMNVRHLKPMGELGQMVPLPFDLTEPATIARTVHSSNVVINLIGNMHQTRNYNYDDTHVKVTHRICKVAAEAGNVEKFVHVSAHGADHNSPSAFLRSKAAGEDVVRDFFPDAIIFRPTTMFGHQDKFINRYAMMMNASMAVPLVDAQAKIQPIFVQDVANAIVNSLADTNSPGRTYSLAGPEVLTYDELISKIAHEIVRPDVFSAPLPPQVARLIGQVMEKTLPVKWRLMTADIVDQMTINQTVRDADNGLYELMVKPTPLDRELNNLCIMHSADRVPYRFETKLNKSIDTPR